MLPRERVALHRSPDSNVKQPRTPRSRGRKSPRGLRQSPSRNREGRRSAGQALFGGCRTLRIRRGFHQEGAALRRSATASGGFATPVSGRASPSATEGRWASQAPGAPVVVPGGRSPEPPGCGAANPARRRRTLAYLAVCLRKTSPRGQSQRHKIIYRNLCQDRLIVAASPSSCPPLWRVSTPCFAPRKKGVDGRDKPGHDGNS